MKLFKIYFPCMLAAVLLFNLSCTKYTPKVAATDTDFIYAATVQVFDGTVNSKGTYVYVDGLPVSGATVSFNGVYPGVAYGFKVAPGTRSFSIKDTLANTKQIPITFDLTADPGKSYTIFTYDTITSVKQTTVVNTITVPADTSCMLRFANLLYNSTALPNVDVYSFRRGGAAIFSNVATAQATPFIPFASGLTDTLYVYATGTTAPLIGKFFVTSLTPTRSYTAAFTGSSKSATKTLSTFATY